MNVLSKHASGIYVLPSPTSVNGYDVATPQIIGHLLSLMQRMFDFVVIDGGQSLDETSLKILQMADIVLLVSILSLPCLSSSKKLLNAFHLLGYPSEERTMVVINRYLKNSQISLKDAQDSLGKEISWTLPNDYPTTLSAISQGKPLSELAPRAAVTKRVRELTSALLKREKKPEERRWRFLKRR
jgi:pilus assembly protein CpaE